MNALLITLVVVILAAVSAFFYLVVDETIVKGQESKWVETFVTSVEDDPDVEQPLTMAALDRTFGIDGGKHTLVLYDEGTPEGEVQGILSANYATHFGKVTMAGISSYQPGQMHQYDAMVFMGPAYYDYAPQALADDILSGQTPVLWGGAGQEQLAGEPDSEQALLFEDKYGWQPHESFLYYGEKITSVEYDGQELVRPVLAGPIRVTIINDHAKAQVVGTAYCGSLDEPVQCADLTTDRFPWAVRSGNLTVVNDIPYEGMMENSHFLALADLYYDLLAPDTAPTQKAAVRLEDVGPKSDAKDLRRVADFLYSRDIPFQVAVMPFHVAEAPNGEGHFGLSLADSPEIVDALKYMQQRGGTLIQHGTSHQFGAIQNPYQGAGTGADFEFIRAQCSATPTPPYEFEECEQDSWVALTGPISRDSVADHAERVKMGRDMMIEVGLGEPDIFEVPHYAATPNAYMGIGEHYDIRYERVQYHAGLMTGHSHENNPSYTQIFPYRVKDIYGTVIYPENLGNITEAMQNNHPARPPSFLIDNARKNLVVRESTASFFFHPYLSTDYLEELVDGIEGLGYTFVPVYEL